MLDQSRQVNPECEHVVGDMRTLDLGRTFDLVFIHDAIMYATDESSLRATLDTAARHCRPGGGVVIVPDFVRETFQPEVTAHGEDGADGRGLRYLEWKWDPDPRDTTFEVAYAFLMRHRDGSMQVEMDRHREGLFPREAMVDMAEGDRIRSDVSTGSLESRRVHWHEAAISRCEEPDVNRVNVLRVRS